MNRWSLSTSLFLHIVILFLIQDSPLRSRKSSPPSSPFTSISLQAINPLSVPQLIRQKKSMHFSSKDQEPSSPSSPSSSARSSSEKKPLPDAKPHPPEPSTAEANEKPPEKNSLQESHPPQLPSTSAASSTGTGNDPQSLENSPYSSFLSEIRQHIHHQLQYPSTLRSQGIEGVVTIQFLIDEEGNLIETQITQSSEYPELNQLALRAIERSSPFSIPKKMGRMKIILPIQFKITQ